MRRLAGLAVAVLLLAGVAGVDNALPAEEVATAEPAAQTARAQRLCPVLKPGSPGVRIAAAASGPGLAQAPLGRPPVAVSGLGLVDAPTEPVQVVAPVTTPFGAATAAWAAAGDERGLSLVACPAAAGEQWIAGVRSGVDARSDLVLINPDAVDAEVNLTVLGTRGRLPAPGARGIVVTASGRRTVPLGPLIDTDGPVALRVETSTGRVAAVVRSRRYAGTEPRGADWIGPTAAPAELAVVAAVPDGSGERDLVLANPGDRAVRVRVDLLGGGGAFQVPGGEQVDVAAESSLVVPLAAGTRGSAAAVRVTADRPVVAAVESRDDAAPASDWATAPAIEELGAEAVLPLPLEGEGVLLLANPTTVPATVSVAVTDRTGKPLVDRQVSVAGESAVSTPLPRDANPTLRLRSASAAVRAGVVVTRPDAQGLAVASLHDSRTQGPRVRTTMDPWVGS